MLQLSVAIIFFVAIKNYILQLVTISYNYYKVPQLLQGIILLVK